MSDPGFELALLAQAIAGLVRYGTVVDVGADYERASVSFVPGQRTAMLKVFQPAASAVKQHTPIAVGEQVMVLSPNGDSNCGAILRGLHGGGNAAPSTSGTMDLRTYPDGTSLSYDWANHRLVFDGMASGATLVLQAKNIVLRLAEGGYYQTDFAGYASRITHKGGANFETESWTTGAVVVGKPDYGFSPPKVVSPGEGA
ncbi:MAG: phage baseplate assembly protein V [Rhodospirillaceae bacterium]|nr:phage baseplate assembly protein V [Rhodospirillales bacterium]